MKRAQLMDLIRSNASTWPAVALPTEVLLSAFPEIPDPVTIAESKQKHKDLEARLGAAGIFVAVTLIEAAQCAECEGELHMGTAEEGANQVGALVGRILALVKHEIQDPSDLLGALEMVRAELARRAEAAEDRHRARRAARETAEAGGGGGGTGRPAPGATDATGGRPGTVSEGEGLPPGVRPGDTAEQAFAAGMKAGEAHPAGSDTQTGSMN